MTKEQFENCTALGHWKPGVGNNTMLFKLHFNAAIGGMVIAVFAFCLRAQSFYIAQVGIHLGADSVTLWETIELISSVLWIGCVGFTLGNLWYLWSYLKKGADLWHKQELWPNSLRPSNPPQ